MKVNKVLPSQIGGAMHEFAVVLPFLVILLMGISDLGVIFSEKTWLSKVAYYSTLAGANSQAQYNSPAVDAAFNRLYQSQANSKILSDNAYLTNISPIGGGAAELEVSARGVASSLFGGAAHPLDFNITFAAPSLVKPRGVAENLDSFENVSGCAYSCQLSCGDPSTPNTNPCPSSIVPPAPPENYGGDCHCFGANTLISMADGSFHNIQDLIVGDEVVTYDLEGAKLSVGRITKLFRNEAKEYFVLNDSIKVTGEHPFFVDGQWVKVKDLTIGSNLMKSTGERILLSTKQLVSEPIRVFNFEVDGAHNYFANGLLAHNKQGVGCDGNGTGGPQDSDT